MAVLKIVEPDEELEIEFELEYQTKLSLRQRFEMLEERKKTFQRILLERGHRKPFEITKRK